MTIRATSRVGVLLVAAAVVVAGCTRPEDRAREAAGDSLPAAVSTTSTTLPTTTTTAPASSTTSTTTTTMASTTSVASSVDTTAPPPPTSSVSPTTTGPIETADDLTLAADGILPLRFGTRDVHVVAQLADVFGAPTADTMTAFPVADDGLFFTDDGEEAFIAPFGRTVCWEQALCADFGAGAPETLIFTGWSLGDEATGSPTETLATDDGIMIGSVLADIADLVTYDPARACFTVVDGFAGGVELLLLSDDGFFSAPNPEGDGVEIFEPDPALVTVIQLSAGERPFFVFADC